MLINLKNHYLLSYLTLFLLVIIPVAVLAMFRILFLFILFYLFIYFFWYWQLLLRQKIHTTTMPSLKVRILLWMLWIIWKHADTLIGRFGWGNVCCCLYTDQLSGLLVQDSILGQYIRGIICSSSHLAFNHHYIHFCVCIEESSSCCNKHIIVISTLL